VLDPYFADEQKTKGYSFVGDIDVKQFVATCDFWQSNKTFDEKAAVLLQPLAVPEFRWQSVSVDFITQLPETAAGHAAVVVFVGRLSKMMLHYVIVKTVVLVGLIGMHKTGCSGETRLVLHVPSSS